MVCRRTKLFRMTEVAMKKENSAPTMKDVAREAGVALGTVSKVVNGLPVGETYNPAWRKPSGN